MLPNRQTRNRRPQQLLCVASLLAAASGLGGCAGDRDIMRLAAETNRAIDAKPAAIAASVELQSYANRLAGLVLEAARADRARFEQEEAGDKPVTPQDSAKNDWIYKTFEAKVVIDPQSNAFVVGADRVYIHTGLIQSVEHPDQLLACLTHEYAHIRLRHSKNNINNQRAQVVGAIAAIAGGALGGRAGGGLAIGGGALSLGSSSLTYSHNKKEESAADAHAVRLFTQMGYDPAQFARFFDVLREKYGDGPSTSTHPKNSDRAAAIRALAAANTSAPTKTLGLEEFRRMQEIASHEERGFSGTTLLGQKSLRSSLMSCFDYCHVQEKPVARR